LAEKTEVVVIGAGPGWPCLRQRKVEFIILEKQSQVGSSWHRHYERLHLHTIKSLSSLPFRNYDRDYPRYSIVPGGRPTDGHIIGEIGAGTST
jgi:cation diffusion facilitator CzcD-associated flavoprotein CzcO